MLRSRPLVIPLPPLPDALSELDDILIDMLFPYLCDGYNVRTLQVVSTKWKDNVKKLSAKQVVSLEEKISNLFFDDNDDKEKIKEIAPYVIVLYEDRIKRLNFFLNAIQKEKGKKSKWQGRFAFFSDSRKKVELRSRRDVLHDPSREDEENLTFLFFLISYLFLALLYASFLVWLSFHLSLTPIVVCIGGITSFFCMGGMFIACLYFAVCNLNLGGVDRFDCYKLSFFSKNIQSIVQQIKEDFQSVKNQQPFQSVNVKMTHLCDFQDEINNQKDRLTERITFLKRQ